MKKAARIARRKPEDLSSDELLLYDMAHQRWRTLPWDKILEEAALMFNLAIFMATHAGRHSTKTREEQLAAVR